MFDRKKPSAFLAPRGIKVGVIVLIIVSLYFLNFEPISRGIKNFFYTLSEPIQRWLWERGAGISGLIEAVSESTNLKEENKRLKTENQELIEKTVELEILKEENQVLKTALGLSLEKEFELKICQVIGKEISRDYLIINKGARHGIEFGLPVITEQKILVGRVSEVYERISKVQLSTSEQSSFDIKILGKEIYGLARGAGDLKLLIELIPREKEVLVTDKVITSALGGNFPEGLLVGEVKSIKKTDITAFQEAEILPSFEPEQLDNLFIISDF